MKKFLISVVVLLSALFISFGGVTAFASGEVDTSSRSAILVDAGSGTVIYSKNETDRLPIASMTKIMLLNLCFEKYDEGVYKFDDDVTVSKNASGMGGSQVFLEENGVYKAKDLLKSIIVASANDASVAMAEFLYGNEEKCVEEMNAKCSEWGLKDTLFSNCTGLTKPTQYSCAKDVAEMFGKLVKHKEYFEFSKIWMDEVKHHEGRVTEISNTNKLVRFYEGCDGGKTGYTSESGHCVAATAKRGGLRLISVVIKGTDSKTRFADASNMFNYGFDNFTSKMVVDCEKPMNIRVSVEKGKRETIGVIAEKNVFVFSERNSKEKIRLDFIPRKTVAPVYAGDIVGEVVVYRDNVEYARVNALANETTEKKIFFDYIYDVAKSM